MKNFLKQFGSLLGAGFAAACCLGLPVVLSALGAAGLGFLVHDAYLFPLFVGFIGLNVWMQYRSAAKKQRLAPFGLGLAGGIVASAGMWLLVTGVYPHAWPVYVGLAGLIAGSLWDWRNGRAVDVCATHACAIDAAPASDAPHRGRRIVTGAALSVAAAGVFYGMYKSADLMVPKTEAGDIACSEASIRAKAPRPRAGMPLADSPANPARARG
ncbi:MAG: MerC domain-containing protein [Vulcanimicrobiaceae bacterium]